LVKGDDEMPDLIKVYDFDGKDIGTCGSSCYDAKEDECKCICGGKNHGVGFRQAMAQTAQVVEDVLKKAEVGSADRKVGEVHNEAKDLKLIESQGTELDDDLASHFFKKVTVMPETRLTVKGWVKALRRLKTEAPMTIVSLPPNTKGLSAGSYNLANLLELIAGNLEGDSQCSVGKE
jgi:hypothetical protein